MYNIALP